MVGNIVETSKKEILFSGFISLPVILAPNFPAGRMSEAILEMVACMTMIINIVGKISFLMVY